MRSPADRYKVPPGPMEYHAVSFDEEESIAPDLLLGGENVVLLNSAPAETPINLGWPRRIR